MRHVSVISKHLISTGFRGLTGCQQDPRDKGVTTWYQSLGKRLPRVLGCGVHTHGPNTSLIAGY